MEGEVDDTSMLLDILTSFIVVQAITPTLAVAWIGRRAHSSSSILTKLADSGGSGASSSRKDRVHIDDSTGASRDD